MTTESPVFGLRALRPLRVRISKVPRPRSSMILSCEEAGFYLVEEQVDDPVDVLLADLDQGVDVFDDLGLGKLFPGHGADPATPSAR